MSGPRPTHAVVSLPVLDLRDGPDHRRELRSQLLMGEVVRLLGTDRTGAWCHIQNEADGYRGWVRAWGLVAASRARAARWRAAARGTVVAVSTWVHAGRGAGAGVSPLHWRSRVIPGRRVGAHRHVELPDGRRGWMKASDLALGNGPRPSMLARLRSLLGVPYLWGGRSSAGLDCSALVQLVLAEQGLELPRDAREQPRACRRLRKGEAPREGDLAFFRRPRERMSHVGIALGGGYFAHARGRVQLGSVEPSNPLYDKRLGPQFAGWFRPRGRD